MQRENDEQIKYTFDDWAKGVLDGVRYKGELCGDNPNVLYSKGLIEQKTAEKIQDEQLAVYNMAIEINYQSIKASWAWAMTTMHRSRLQAYVSNCLMQVNKELLRTSHAEKMAASQNLVDTDGIDGATYQRILTAQKNFAKGGTSVVHITKRVPGDVTIFNHRLVTAVNQKLKAYLEPIFEKVKSIDYNG